MLSFVQLFPLAKTDEILVTLAPILQFDNQYQLIQVPLQVATALTSRLRRTSSASWSGSLLDLAAAKPPTTMVGVPVRRRSAQMQQVGC